MSNPPESNQPGYQRLILPAPIGRVASEDARLEARLLARLDSRTVMMMGDNPALPKMPEKPALLDFFRYRFIGEDITRNHLLAGAKRALDAGERDTVVLACLLHDFSVGTLIRCDHGYWAAQMIRSYVEEEVAWAVEKHQALRYFADPEVGYHYPESYNRFFGADYVPPEYIRREAEAARDHPWYATARLLTKYDLYFFDAAEPVDPDVFTDVVARAFRQPAEGLGFDGSPVAHMWRTLIWPQNFL